MQTPVHQLSTLQCHHLKLIYTLSVFHHVGKICKDRDTVIIVPSKKCRIIFHQRKEFLLFLSAVLRNMVKEVEFQAHWKYEFLP